MTVEKASFRSLASELRDATLNRFEKSERYTAFAVAFDEILLLADRIVRACELHSELGRAAAVTDALVVLRDPQLRDVDQLLDKVELWLKAVLRVTKPDIYRARKTDDGMNGSRRSFNLFQSLVDLGLGTKSELNTPAGEIERVPDAVLKSLCYAKLDRNDSTHETGLSDSELRNRQQTGACTAILAPLFIHREAIERSLMGLVTRLPNFGVARDVNKMVDSERRLHLSRFYGRDEDIASVIERIEAAKNGGYVLITAGEGTGKSALCAKISEVLKTAALRPSGEVWGAHAGTVAREMPWLPGVVLHFGKSASAVEAIAAFVVAQAQSMTLSVVRGLQDAEDSDGMRAISDAQMPYERFAGDGSRTSKGNQMQSGTGIDITTPRWTVKRSEQLRRAVFASLDAIAKERGSAVLIIDAMEEISEDATTLDFLPSRLPAGVAALVTARANTPAVQWAIDNLHIATHVSLQCLTRDDIPKVSRVPDDSSDHRLFNDNLFHASGGLPLAVHRILDGVDITQPRLGDVQLVGGLNQLHARQATAWLGLGPVGKQSLIALSLFEPAGPLSLELLQSFLKQRQPEAPDLSDLRVLLMPVANQIQGFEERRLKLSNRPFAEYVRTTEFGKADVVEPLKALAAALCEESSVSATSLAAFLDFWGSDVRHEEHREVVEDILKNLSIAKAGKRLYAVARSAEVWQENRKPYAMGALQAAAKLEYPPAMRLLGLMTLDGRGTQATPEEGKRLLLLAGERGDDRALLALGERLLEGRGISVCVEEGLRYLEQAIQRNSEEALFALGNRLIIGRNVAADVTRGRHLLERAAAIGFGPAILAMASLLLDGKILPKDVTSARRWLEKAAQSENQTAMVELGLLLINSEKSGPDRDAGQRWLERSVQLDNTYAMTSLAILMFAGKSVPQDIERATMLLTKAANEGDEQSMRILGRRLVEGDGFPENRQEGLAWLERAAAAGDVLAVDVMDKTYLRMLSQSADRAAAEAWFLQAIKSRAPDDAGSLGSFLYTNEQKPLAAKAFLESFIRGHLEAGNNLFYMLRRGESVGVETTVNAYALVDKLVEQKYSFALVNKALALAAGYACEGDWQAADALIGEIVVDEDNVDLVEWWHDLARKEEGEGHLIIGWLTHHGIITDPEGCRPRQRFLKAMQLGWSIPAWLIDAALA